MVLRGFERRLERLVEGTFARAFRSGVRPVELGRRLSRCMDDDRSVDVKGRTIAPNMFEIALAEPDFRRFSEVGDSLRRELVEAAREHAADRGYSFMGPVDVAMSIDGHLYEGQFQVSASYRQGAGGTGAGALRLPDGSRYSLGAQVVVIGRLAECDLVVEDSNVSRRHAEIRPEGSEYVVLDLGSTNGTLVNGSRVTRHALRDGDRLAVGVATFGFEAS